jgi:nitrite reductase/ring-hydroxylating ferredoxin subunit
MSEFQTVANVGDIPEGEGRCFTVEDTMVAVFLDGGNYHAINDFCPHMGASLAGGHVEDGAVMCPWHAWRFRLSDGLWCDNSKAGIRTATYDVRILDGQIQVRVPEPTDSGDSVDVDS